MKHSVRLKLENCKHTSFYSAWFIALNRCCVFFVFVFLNKLKANPAKNK